MGDWMKRSDDTVTLSDVSVLHETEDAILCSIEGEEVWIPKSQIHDDSEVYQADTEGDLIISQWLAAKKGLG